ncbi:MAG TPA: hypothetical protein GXZ21_07700 [Clostridiales bacterium]|nr:hypothetical protein [Clostridiales bacterium]
MKDAASTYHYETASMYRDMLGKLEYVKHGLNGYRDLFPKRLVLKIPTKDGVKLFYVNKGNILLTKKYKRLSLLNKYIEKFIEKGSDIKIDNNYLPDDKGSIDYRDILYSEINNLDEDMVINLN